MSSLYTFNNNVYITSDSVGSEHFMKKSENKELSKRTDSSEFGSKIYENILPSNMDIFEDTTNILNDMTNVYVKKTIERILKLLRSTVSSEKNLMNSKLSKIIISPMDDESALIEWNFEKFRIGLSVENENDQSSYFILDKTDEGDAIITLSKMINENNYDQAIDVIVSYVKRNT